MPHKSDFVAPATVSEEAKAEIEAFSRKDRDAPLPDPSDLSGWKKTHAKFERDYAEASVVVREHFRPQITESELGGVPVLDVRPDGWQPDDRLLVYIHGGGYTLFSATSTLNGAIPIASETGIRVLSVDYTPAPFAKWEEMTDQVVAVIQAAVADGRSFNQIAVYGDSAGGGLTAGAVLKMRDQGLGMPAAVVLWSPWSDVTDTGDSYATLSEADPVLYYPGTLKNCADAYAAPTDQKHPYVSPVYADYAPGFPPTLIQCGTKEIFLSNAVRHYQALDTAEIPVKLDLYEGMYHGFQSFGWSLPEAQLVVKKMAKFLDAHLAS